MIKFEWDAAKARSNLKKHGVSFSEAESVFYDEFAIQFFDEENAELEDRFLMLGFSNESRLLIVCHCERSAGEIIRIFPPARQPETKKNTMKVVGHEERI